MGLDGVEIVMALEEEFHVALPDGKVGEADTVGKMVELILPMLRASPEDPCPSQRGFHRVRSGLMEVLGVDRKDIEPDTLLEGLIPVENRGEIWARLNRVVADGITPSIALRRPVWLDRLVLWVLPGTTFLMTLIWLPLERVWLGFFPATAVLLCGVGGTRRFQTRFPNHCLRVKDLIPLAAARDDRVWTEEEVLEKVRDITVDILGVERERVTPNARWVEDLGVG